MDLENELRQLRMTTGGIQLVKLEGGTWMNSDFQEHLDELEVELFDTGVLVRSSRDPQLKSQRQ